jgi:hypothetical protein
MIDNRCPRLGSYSKEKVDGLDDSHARREPLVSLLQR